MSGQLLRAERRRRPLPKHTHVVITFTQGGQLRFVDPRTFGELFVTAPASSTRTCPSWPTSGSTRSRTPMQLGRLRPSCCGRRQTKLKTLLMDQRFIAGIGNIYTDEILFAAGLRYDRSRRTR